MKGCSLADGINPPFVRAVEVKVISEIAHGASSDVLDDSEDVGCKLPGGSSKRRTWQGLN